MNAVSASRSNGHLLRCQSALRAHVRIVGAGFKPAPTEQSNANGDFPTGAPCIWPSLNRLQYPMTRTHS